MPVETGDKKGLNLGPGLDDAVVPDAVDGDGARRRRRRGMRVPSDDVPRPQPSAPAVAADDDFDVDIEDSDPVPGDGVVEPAPATGSERVTAIERELSAPIRMPPAELPFALEPAADVPMHGVVLDEPVEPVEEAVEPLEEPVEPLADLAPLAAAEPRDEAGDTLEEPAAPLAEAVESMAADGAAPAAAADSPSPAATSPAPLAAVATELPVEVTGAPTAVPAAEEPAWSSVVEQPREEEPEEISSAELEEDQSPRPLPPPRPPKMARPAPPPAPPAASSGPPPAPVPQHVVAEPTGRRRKGKAWFEEAFDEDYLRTLPFLLPQTTQREASFLLDALGGKPGQQLLDVGCGYGRHAMELAARGHHVTALDLSLPLLLRGADEAQRRGLVINFVHGDMREMSYEAQFDGAYCFFSTFGYFDDDTNKRVAAAIGRSLKPGGRLVLDLLNRDYIVADLPTRIWWEGDGCVVLEEVDFNYYNSRLVSNRSVVFEDGRQTELEISIRSYSLHEVGKLLHSAGFRVLSVSGGLAARGRFFGKDSRQILVVAERRGSESGARDASSSPLDSAGNGKT